MHYTRYITAFVLAALALPIYSYAATPQDFGDVVDFFLEVIQSFLIPIIFGLTLLFFLWGVTQTWILQSDDKESIQKGKQIVVASIIAFIVMSSIWGIITMVQVSLF